MTKKDHKKKNLGSLLTYYWCAIDIFIDIFRIAFATLRIEEINKMRHLPKTLIQLQKQYLDYCTVLYMSGYFTFQTWRSDLEVVQPFCTFALGQKFAMSGSFSLNCKDISRTFLLSGTFSTSLGSSGFSNSSIVQPRMYMPVRSLYLQRLKLCLKLQMLCLYHTSQIYSASKMYKALWYGHDIHWHTIYILSTSISPI